MMKSRLYYLFAVFALVLCVQGCGKEGPIDKSFDNGEYGKIAPGEYVATGDYVNLSVSSANLLCSINSELIGTNLAKCTFGVVLSTDKAKLKNSGGQMQSTKIIGNCYEVVAGNLFPDTEYFYCAYLSMDGGPTFFASEIKSFKTKELPSSGAIDLGLPSGLKWASCNLGASSPEKYGDYYAWGETEAKANYSSKTSKWNGVSYDYLKSQGVIDGKGNLTAKYDVATVKLGGKWKMPTFDEIEELENNCIWIWGEYKGMDGYLVTGKNGNSIFLPAAGNRYGTDLNFAGWHICYWSSTAVDFSYYAYGLYLSSGYHDGDYYYLRYYGFTVRPVSE